MPCLFECTKTHSSPLVVTSLCAFSPGMCAVRLEFGAFHMPSTADCKSAFMELQKRKFCNNQLDHSTTGNALYSCESSVSHCSDNEVPSYWL
jgi:hypothetical protein